MKVLLTDGSGLFAGGSVMSYALTPEAWDAIRQHSDAGQRPATDLQRMPTR